jgi:hypothetical protein
LFGLIGRGKISVAKKYICSLTHIIILLEMKKTLTLLLLMTGIACYGQKIKLQLNLKLDSTYYLNDNANFTAVEDIPGHPQVLTMMISGKMSHKVVAIKDTVYQMAVAYENISMLVELSGQRLINVNTDLKGQDIMSKIMTSMLHKPLTAFISKKGKVLEIRNSDTLYSHLFDELPQLTAEKKAQFKEQMQKSFGDKALKNNFQDAFAVLPQTDVGINDSWIFTSIMEAVVLAKVKTTYVLKDIAGGAYIVHGDAVVGSVGTADYAEMNGMPMRFNNVSGTYSTDVKIDKDTGWLIESKIVRNIKGTVEIKDNAKVPGGMIFPMTISGDITMSNK